MHSPPYLTLDKDVQQVRQSDVDGFAAQMSGMRAISIHAAKRAARVVATYGTNYPRIQRMKQRFDPGNPFRMNLNIVPVASPQLQESS